LFDNTLQFYVKFKQLTNRSHNFCVVHDQKFSIHLKFDLNFKLQLAFENRPTPNKKHYHTKPEAPLSLFSSSQPYTSPKWFSPMLNLPWNGCVMTKYLPPVLMQHFSYYLCITCLIGD